MPPKFECDLFAGPGLKPNNLKMVAGDKDMLDKLLTLKQGEEVVIKGTPGESGVVMCTEEATFEVTVLETTNSCFLCKKGDGEDKVVVGWADHAEVLKRVPGVVRESLGGLLKEPRSTGFYLENLKASEKEIMKQLEESPAVEIDELWVLPDSEEVAGALETLLRIGDVEFDLEKFTSEECIEKLSEYHSQPALLGAIQSYCTSEGGFNRIDPTLVALSSAANLFEVNKTWPYDTFMSEWVSCCPSIVVPTSEMLQGFALTTSKTVTHFPSASLPTTPEDRFAALFTARPQWDKDLLKLYIKPLVGPGVVEAQLISRYTREFTIDGKQMYVAF